MAGESKGEKTTSPPPTRWEDLDPNLLAEIFGRLDSADLLRSIAFVCKPWKHATHLPRCWGTLHFPRTYAILSGVTSFLPTGSLVRFTSSGLLKLLLSKSQRSTTLLVLCVEGCFGYFKSEDLQLLSKECPELKHLVLTWQSRQQEEQICELVEKWANLEALSMEGLPHNVTMKQLLGRISRNCKKFDCLQLSNLYVESWLVSDIVEYLPGLKRLEIRNARIDRKEVVYLLKGLRHLARLSIRDCCGFVPNEEIAAYASSTETFICESCKPCEEEKDKFANKYGNLFDIMYASNMALDYDDTL